MKKKINKTKKELLKLNVFVTVLICIVNLIVFFVIDSSKDNFTRISYFTTGILFFVYLVLFSSTIKTKLMDIKKEALYINYPLNIALFFTFLFLVLIASAISLVSVNEDAANITFIFTFFMSTISMLFPSIILIVFMFFAVPTLIVPGINQQKRKNSGSNLLLTIFFILFLVLCIYNGFNSFIKTKNFESQERFKSSRLTISYSTDFLKISNAINSYSQKKMSINTADVPFDYTEKSVPYSDYESADRFCRALDARMPNYLETYFIVFNKFDTFGDKYFWTSHKDGKHDLVLHFKNMSYEIVRKPANVTPQLYCIAKSKDNYGFKHKTYFYRDVQQESAETIKSLVEKPFNFESLKDIVGMEQKQTREIPPIQNELPAISETKFVNFSVKEVSNEVFRNLLQKGYYYNPTVFIKREYETNDFAFSQTVQRSTNNIRLCYFPFTDYGNMSLYQEKQIWEQSFCSPAFDLMSQTPVQKTKYEKDSYCYANGGRLPNIPELVAILKTQGNINSNISYWTNNKITDASTNSKIPVLVYFKDSKILQVRPITSIENYSAYTYCIKKPKHPSSVIANFKSRFKNVEGHYYAKQKCPNCHYYEVPDVILQQ